MLNRIGIVTRIFTGAPSFWAGLNFHLLTAASAAASNSTFEDLVTEQLVTVPV